MIKALNLQPISAPSADRVAQRRAVASRKDGGAATRADEIQDLRDFAKAQKAKDRPAEAVHHAPAPAPAAVPVQKPIEDSNPQALATWQTPTELVMTKEFVPASSLPKDVGQNVVEFVPAAMKQEIAPAAAAASTAAPAGGLKSKGIRLKNASINRAGNAEPVAVKEKDSALVVKTAAAAAADSAPSDMTAPDEPKASSGGASTSQAKKVTSAVLLGRTQGFQRSMMLHFWKVSKAVPSIKSELGYRTAMRDEAGQSPSPGETWRFPRKDRGNLTDSSPSWRNSMGKSSKSGSKNQKGGGGGESLKPGENAYRVQKATTREAELARDTRSLLNKICPENRDRIIDRLAQTQFDTVDEMEIVINIIFLKVTDDAHYCETYVDMIHALHKAYPQFEPQEEGAQPVTFRRMLVGTCQDKFEEMLHNVENGPDEKDCEDENDFRLELIKQKRQAMATMKFIGHLFVRQLLAAAVIRQVIGDLLNGEPPELQVEYALELVTAVGKQFEATEKDKAQLSVILDRLSSLKSMKGPDGKGLLSKRVQFCIQDISDLRANGWKKSGFKEEAKTKDEVAVDAVREEQLAATQQAQNRGGGYGGGGKGGANRGRR